MQCGPIFISEALDIKFRMLFIILDGLQFARGNYNKNLIHELLFLACLIHNKLAFYPTFYNIFNVTNPLTILCFKENIKNTNLILYSKILQEVTDDKESKEIAEVHQKLFEVRS